MIAEEPPAEFVDASSETYTDEGVRLVWIAPVRTLGGRPCDLWATDKQRVLEWLDGLANGVMG